MSIVNAEPVTVPTLIATNRVPTAVVRHPGVTVAALPALFDAGYPAIAASGAELAGPAFALFRGDASASFDLELGFPLARPLAAPVPGTLEVEPSELPAGQAFAMSHFGPYEALPQSWARLSAAASARGFTPTCFYEVYVTEPSPDIDPTTLRTDLFLVGSSQ